MPAVVAAARVSSSVSREGAGGQLGARGCGVVWQARAGWGKRRPAGGQPTPSGSHCSCRCPLLRIVARRATQDPQLCQACSHAQLAQPSQHPSPPPPRTSTAHAPLLCASTSRKKEVARGTISAFCTQQASTAGAAKGGAERRHLSQDTSLAAGSRLQARVPAAARRRQRCAPQRGTTLSPRSTPTHLCTSAGPTLVSQHQHTFDVNIAGALFCPPAAAPTHLVLAQVPHILGGAARPQLARRYPPPRRQHTARRQHCRGKEEGGGRASRRWAGRQAGRCGTSAAAARRQQQEAACRHTPALHGTRERPGGQARAPAQAAVAVCRGCRGCIACRGLRRPACPPALARSCPQR